MDYQEIADDTFFEVSDLEWYEKNDPKTLLYIERWYSDDFRFSIEKFGAYDEYMDWCFYYDLAPENPEGYCVDLDGGLSGIYVYHLV